MENCAPLLKIPGSAPVSMYRQKTVYSSAATHYHSGIIFLAVIDEKCAVSITSSRNQRNVVLNTNLDDGSLGLLSDNWSSHDR